MMRRRIFTILTAMTLLVCLVATAVMAETENVCKIGDTGFKTIAEAVGAAEADSVITLLTNAEISETTKAVTVDLNGNNLTVTGGTVTVLDSATDDFKAEGGYGKVTGNATAAEGYLTVEEEDGTLSFHKVELVIRAMSLRASVVGVYYKSTFKADEVAAANIASFGVALNIKEAPSKENMGTTSAYSKFTEFVGGGADNAGNGTILRGIMKTSNSDRSNAKNANISIYGAPYVLTKNGEYIFGTCVQRSLKEQLEAIDKLWKGYSMETKKSVLSMYKAYKGIVDEWDISDIKADDPSNDDVLKVLVVGNSHGLDATRMLYDVFEEQAPNQKVILGNLYYSGCRVGQHADFMTNNQAVYEYHKNTSGTWASEKSVIADVAIEDEQWDIVIMQQMNYWAGRDSMYDKEEFETVINYIKDRQQSTPEFRWHMVWPNPEGVYPSGSPDWEKRHNEYFGDSTGVYKSIILYNEVTRLTQKNILDSTDFLGEKVFTSVIPSATVIQYADDVCGRPQNQLYRDYTHLTGYSRLMVSYLWYANLMGVDEITYVGHNEVKAEHLSKGTNYYPAAVDGKYPLDEQMKTDLMAAVNWALKHPYELP